MGMVPVGGVAFWPEAFFEPDRADLGVELPARRYPGGSKGWFGKRSAPARPGDPVGTSRLPATASPPECATTGIEPLSDDLVRMKSAVSQRPPRDLHRASHGKVLGGILYQINMLESGFEGA
jgi:hypothetical protein